MRGEGLGVYVHVPFCAQRCPYCDFYSVASDLKKSEYIDVALQELGMLRGEFVGRATSLYFGGGTPSRLGVGEIGRFVDAVRNGYGLLPDAEITVELNPDDAYREYYDGLLRVGVNRVSVGVQSVDGGVLSFLGRSHSAIQGLHAVEEARAAGIDNVSGDVIYGVLGQSEEAVRATCRSLVDAGCTHVSAYHLIVEEATQFGRRYAAGEFREVDEEVSVAHYMAVCDEMRRAGFFHYEVSSYARVGRESKHNSLYWRGGRYVGIGPGAHSYDGQRRWWNVRNLSEYVGKVGRMELAREIEILGEEGRFEEWLLTGLRLSEGIDLKEGIQIFGEGRIAGVRRRAAGWVDRGAVAIEGDRVRVTEEGFVVLDAVVLDLSCCG